MTHGDRQRTHGLLTAHQCRSGLRDTNPGARMQKANRTAGWIIKEWILAQMALIGTEMVSVEEVCLPVSM